MQIGLINKEILIKYLYDFQNINYIYLEIGPSSAPLLEHLYLIKNTHKIVIDLPNMLDYCQKLGFICIEQDCSNEDWKIQSNSIDVVISNQCLEHIPNTDHFICQVYRVLKEEGIFIISVPNQGALAFIILLLFTINPPMNFVSDKFCGLGNPLSNVRWNPRNYPGHGHLRLFSTRAMNDLLKAHGFEVLKNHGGSWGIPIIGRSLAKIFPYYGLYTTVLARKTPQKG